MMGYEQQLRGNVSGAQRAMSQVGQAIDQGRQAIEEAVVIYYAINRLWTSIEEYFRTGIPPVIR